MGLIIHWTLLTSPTATLTNFNDIHHYMYDSFLQTHYKDHIMAAIIIMTFFASLKGEAISEVHARANLTLY